MSNLNNESDNFNEKDNNSLSEDNLDQNEKIVIDDNTDQNDNNIDGDNDNSAHQDEDEVGTTPLLEKYNIKFIFLCKLFAKLVVQ